MYPLLILVCVYVTGSDSLIETIHCPCIIINTSAVDIVPVSGISLSTPITVTAGETVKLQCSVDITPHPLPAGTSTPEFEWFFGQAFDSPLTSTTTNSSSNYSSTVEIGPVRESDRGIYTCRLRGNHRTAVNTAIIVEPGNQLSHERSR